MGAACSVRPGGGDYTFSMIEITASDTSPAVTATTSKW